MRMKTANFTLLLLMFMIMSACLAQIDAVSAEGTEIEPAGFWLGLWHGFILLFSFIISLFRENTTVYAALNTGWPYNLGFLIGVMSFFGGGKGAADSGRRRKCRDIEGDTENREETR